MVVSFTLTAYDLGQHFPGVVEYYFPTFLTTPSFGRAALAHFFGGAPKDCDNIAPLNFPWQKIFQRCP